MLRIIYAVISAQLLSLVVTQPQLLPITDGDIGYGYFPDGTPLVEWINITYYDPGVQQPLVRRPVPPFPALWVPPRPAEGQSPNVDSLPYDQTLFLPYQNFSDISFYQLNLFWKTYNQIITIAAQSAGVGLEDGPKVFVKQSFYTLCVWFPENLATIRLPDAEAIWTNPIADEVFTDMASEMHQQYIELYLEPNGNIGFVGNVEAVIDIADNAAYAHHRVNGLSPRNKITRSTYFHLIDAQMGAAKFFLGAAYNDEVASALSSVFTFLNTLNWHYLDLYDIGCLKRSEVPNYIVYNSEALGGSSSAKSESGSIQNKKVNHADFVGTMPLFGFK